MRKPQIHMRVEVRRPCTPLDRLNEVRTWTYEIDNRARTLHRLLSHEREDDSVGRQLECLCELKRALGQDQIDPRESRWTLVGHEFINIDEVVNRLRFDHRIDQTRFASEPPFRTGEPYNNRGEHDLLALLVDDDEFSDGVIPSISKPRGLPDDVSPGGNVFMQIHPCGHFHSFVTLAELEAVDWNQQVHRTGILSEWDYIAFRNDGSRPKLFGDPTPAPPEHRTPIGEIQGELVLTPEAFETWLARGRPELAGSAVDAWVAAGTVIDTGMLYTIIGEVAPPTGGDPIRVFNTSLDSWASPDRWVYIRTEWEYQLRRGVKSFRRHAYPQLRRLQGRYGVSPEDVRILFYFT